MYGCKRRSE